MDIDPKSKFVEAALLIVIGLEAIVLAQWVTYPYWPENLVLLRDAEAGLFAALAPFSPLVLVLMLYGRPLMLLGRRTIWWSSRLRAILSFPIEALSPTFKKLRSTNFPESARAIKLLSYPRWLLAIATATSGLVGYLPYRPDLNPLGTLVGVDSPLYEQWLGEMRRRPLDESIAYAFGAAASGSRPLFLVPVYLLGQLVGVDSRQIVLGLPIFLGPLLSLTTFLFVRSGREGERIAVLAALLTGFSFDITVGMWGTYYANLLALAEAYLFLSILLSFHREITFPKYASLTVLSLIILLTHPWTWVLVLTASTLFSLTFDPETRKTSQTTYMALIIAIGLSADFLKNWMFGVGTVAEDIATKAPVAGLQELTMFWPNVIEALLYTHGGLMSNVVFLALAAAGVLALRWDKPFQRLLMIWVSVAGLAIAFFDSYHISRIIYDMPLPTISALGLILLASAERGRFRWPGLLMLLGVLFSASYAVRAMLQL